MNQSINQEKNSVENIKGAVMVKILGGSFPFNASTFQINVWLTQKEI